MRITEFSVRHQRAVRLAACESVPRVMLVTGPNGCGKSTLLNSLRSAGSGPGRTLYVGPHRTSRRQNVRMRFLSQQRIEMSALLSASSLPGFEGIDLPSRERDAWNYDESQSYLKYTLCQIELDRQAAISTRFDTMGSVLKDDLPDVWKPLREMTHNLLPHLQFHRIDVSNRDQVRCLWRVHAKDVLVDIDDLSSGEKAVIQLFFPLIEHQIDESLAVFASSEPAKSRGSTAVLMDEPELHLHPHLQSKVFDYIRAVSIKEDVQFILASHSPVMVEQSTSEELYLLRPAELVGADENQLVRIANTEEKLQAIREVFGTTSNVTAMRKIVVVEGVTASADSRRAVDARIYAFLDDRFGQVNIVSGGGKSEVRNLVSRLNEMLNPISPTVNATALLDRDLETIDVSSENVVLLPVSMVENLLVDPNVVWNAIATVRHKTSFSSAADLAKALDEILDEFEIQEVDRRVKTAIPARTFRVTDPVMDARNQVNDFASALLTELTDEKIRKLQTAGQEAVAALKAEHKRREHFDGKRILSEFYKRFLHATGMSKEIFIYDCAKEASNRKSVKDFVTSLFKSLRIVDPDNSNEKPDSGKDAVRPS